MSFPPCIEGGKENLEISEAGGSRKFPEAGGIFRGWESNFSGSGKGETQNSDAKIILNTILIQK